MSEAFKANLGKVSLSNGEEVELPRLTIGRLKTVSKSVANLVTKIKEAAPDVFSMDVSTDSAALTAGARIMGALPSVLPEVFDEVVAVVSSYLNKDQKWVEESLDLEDMSKILYPFFGSILSQGNILLSAFNEAVSGKSKS